MELTAVDATTVRVAFTGRLDSQGVEQVEGDFISSVVPGGRNAVIDLSRVDFIASLGIRMLVSAARSLRGRQARLALFAPQDRVAQVFEAVALQKIIPIVATEAEALAAIAPGHGTAGV